MDPEYQTYGEDTFGLEFAAVQWLNLVTNAEEIFNKLLHSILLSGEEKEHIQRWLCLKQECEDCVGSDEATSFDGRQRHSLERIEELTEDTENTQELGEINGKSSDSQYESDSESDFDYQHPEFDDKLEKYMQCFRDKVDRMIRSKLKSEETAPSVSAEVASIKRPASFPQHFLPPGAHQKGRRKSLHPGCISVPIKLNEITKNSAKSNESVESKSEEKQSNEKNDLLFLENAHPVETNESNKELKGLTLKLESKKTQIKHLSIDLESYHKKLAKLEHTIEMKERFIEERLRNSTTRKTVKLRFRKRYTKLQEEYYKIRTQIAHAEHILQEKKHSNDIESVLRQKSEIEKQKNLAKHYEKRLKDIIMIQQIASEKSAKTVQESENSILKLKKEIDKIKETIEKEENRREKLEDEVREDEEKIKALKENLQVSPKCESSPEKSEPVRLPILDIQTSSTSTENIDERKKEFVDLRNAKDCLIDRKERLHDKYRKNLTLSSLEKRRILECDEGIEAIDQVIEYKNEMLCGRTSLESLCPTSQETQEEQMLVDRLLRLSFDEVITLVLKYFRKVIDLKENNRIMEQQNYELEEETEKQAWRIQYLTQILQIQGIEAERQKVALQRCHQEEVSLMMRYLADESGSSGTEGRSQLALSKDDEMSKLRRENKSLRRRLQEMQDVMQVAALTKGVPRFRSRSASPETHPLKQLPAPPQGQPASCSTSRVTREKNKVIIRLNAPKKKSSNKSLISFTHQK